MWLLCNVMSESYAAAEAVMNFWWCRFYILPYQQDICALVSLFFFHGIRHYKSLQHYQSYELSTQGTKIPLALRTSRTSGKRTDDVSHPLHTFGAEAVRPMVQSPSGTELRTPFWYLKCSLFASKCVVSMNILSIHILNHYLKTLHLYYFHQQEQLNNERFKTETSQLSSLSTSNCVEYEKWL